MKNIEEINSAQIMSRSTANIELDNESANNSPARFYSINSLTEPAEILMGLILPMVANRLKNHREIMKLKGSNTNMIDNKQARDEAHGTTNYENNKIYKSVDFHN